MQIWLYEKIREILENLNHIGTFLVKMNKQELQMATALELLKVEVEETKGAVNSAIALIEGLSDYIRAHVNDPAALLEMVAELDAKQAEIAVAVLANPVPTE